MTRPVLKLDWCSHAAAKYACEKWHYSGTMPVGKTVKVGVWENGTFVGCVIFSRGATPEIGSPYKLDQTKICELTRVALTTHTTPVSRVLAVAFKFLKNSSPELRLIVYFADQSQGHHGGIYQASNWLYCGGTNTHAYRVNGTNVHPKTLHGRYGVGGQSIPWLRANVDANAARVVAGFKHRYLYPLDEEMRQRIAPLAKPYPKRARSADSGTSGHQPEGGGATPTRALSTGKKAVLDG